MTADENEITDTGNPWYTQIGWNGNPFILEIRPELMAGYRKEILDLERNISEAQKYILITGPTGAGKTTVMRYLSKKYSPIYVPKPPRDKEEFVEIFKGNILKPRFFDIFLKKKNVTVYNLADEINARLSGKKMIFLVDEAHETDVHILEWLRAIIDSIDGATLVLAGLPVFKKTHLEKLETLKQRVTLEVELGTLSREETAELVRKRIEAAGGRNLEPFSFDAMDEIYKRSGGFPRETIKICNGLVHEAISRNSRVIDSTFFVKKEAIDEAISIRESLEVLTSKQKEIVDLLGATGGLTPAEIIEKIDCEDYQSKTHALRAINNILKRLESNNIISREKRGRAYKYKLAGKLKNAMIEA